LGTFYYGTALSYQTLYWWERAGSDSSPVLIKKQQEFRGGEPTGPASNALSLRLHDERPEVLVRFSDREETFASFAFEPGTARLELNPQNYAVKFAENGAVSSYAYCFHCDGCGCEEDASWGRVQIQHDEFGNLMGRDDLSGEKFPASNFEIKRNEHGDWVERQEYWTNGSGEKEVRLVLYHADAVSERSDEPEPP